MRILSLHFNSTTNGGAEVVCFQGNRLLAERGHQVAWLTIGVPQQAQQHGEAVFWLPEKPGPFAGALGQLYNPAAVRLAKQAIRQFRPQVVHLHNVFGYRHLSPAVLLPFRQAGIPVVQTLHDYSLVCPASFFLSAGQVCERCGGRAYYHCAIRRCRYGSLLKSSAAMVKAFLKDHFYHYDRLITHYIAPSRFLRQKYLQFGYPPDKIEVIPNAYFQQILPPMSGPIGGYILFAGRLSPEKGVDVLIRAASGLDVQVKIAGDGAERARLEDLRRQLCAMNVEFLGSQDYAAMAALYRDAALIVVPSRWYENGPLVILEAFAQAKPVIASEIGALPEFIHPGQTGVLFRPNDPADLRRILQSVLADPVGLQRMGKNAFEYLRSVHSPSAYVQALENTLQWQADRKRTT